MNSSDWKIENVSNALSFKTASDNFNSTADEAMRINSNGFVGIGTTAPVALEAMEKQINALLAKP